MKLYLIGPSGVGKTSFGQYAEKNFGLKHIDIDEILHRHTPVWLDFKKVLDKVMKRDNITIDIGAGYQKYPELPNYLVNTHCPITLITADPDEVIIRNPWGASRNKVEFLNTEYNNMKLLYNTATRKVDITGKDEQSSQRVFEKILKQLLRDRT